MSDTNSLLQMSKKMYALWSPPPPAGWFRLWDDFRVAVKTKPDQRHIDNMRDTFGWEWIDHE